LNGTIVKDLSYLNRDLSKVIVLDTKPEHVRLHPENAIILPKWTGDPQDRGLIAMIPFLECKFFAALVGVELTGFPAIGIFKPDDIRPILKAYEGKDIPIEYAKKEAEAKARHIEQWKSKNKALPASGLRSAFGLSQPSPIQTRGGPPPTYLEQKRAEAQMQYREEQKYIRENKEHLEKLLKQEQDAIAAQVPSNLWEAIDQITGKPKDPSAEGAVAAAATTGGAEAPKS